jgi:hypothetical protein
MQDLDFFKYSTREIIGNAVIDAYNVGKSDKSVNKYVDK